MSCRPCADAEANPLTGSIGFEDKCDGCAARSLAHSPLYFVAARSGALTPAYRDALQSRFGRAWKSAHEQVKAWAQRIDHARRKS
ncbi:hypothetical protein AAW51_2105 [Caldimonas brevitalea]|uniref:Uncharacterized protein n=1 Tax=Caldimonas brevitalea TaxID=413882 RepID=A0A0G3BN73_9BURK|nr:hypothetical protein AAW51_2105 [Caldimonas brevitalea]